MIPQAGMEKLKMPDPCRYMLKNIKSKKVINIMDFIMIEDSEQFDCN